MEETIIELSPAEAHQQRLKELILQKALDKNWGIFQQQIMPALAELNIRLVQYKAQYKTYSVEFLVFQSVQDFNRLAVPLQKVKLDESKPVAMDRSNQKAIIFKDNEFQYKE